METKKLKIRPYARLLTMLGEQLIKNEQIALAELIKNSYDADADWVKVEFNNVLDQEKGTSNIIVEDNGSGMTFEKIQKSWMNPATPNKYLGSAIAKKTKGGRVVQGEKGIGRFAILKLGQKITIVTRPENCDKEYVINYDFSAYDNDFMTENGESKELFLDDIEIAVSAREPQVFNSRNEYIQGVNFRCNETGTKIIISGLKSKWTREKIKQVNQESQKLEYLFERSINRNSSSKPFYISFKLDGEELNYSSESVERLTQLTKNSSVLQITEGLYIESEKVFKFRLNGTESELSLEDPKIIGLNVFKKHFVLRTDDKQFEVKKSNCGNFRFTFYVFDLSAGKDSKYYLDKEEKELVKEHRVYLYRDGIRVAPYGDPDNDWLGTDKKRATGRTGDYLSNDQVVGFVDISKIENPLLKDKTNREGLIEDGNATSDFIVLLHSFLLYIRQNPYQRYQQNEIRKTAQKDKQARLLGEEFKKLEEKISGNTEAQKAYSKVFKLYLNEKKANQRKLQITEDLAGVGLSVETASHDLMLMLVRGLEALDTLIRRSRVADIQPSELFENLSSIRGMFSFVKDQMKNLQLLFRSSRQRKRMIRIEDIIGKVVKIYSSTLERENILCEIEKIGSPVVVNSTDAVFLQVFINLFDNAIYWLDTVNGQKKIKIILDGDKQQIIFSDTGPGINDDDVPYIFDAFYSGKSMGRGLGLYIAKQLLTRMDCSISLIDKVSDKVLPGANFLIETFVGEENA